MSRKATLKQTTQAARIVIVTRSAGCLDLTIPLTVAAVVAWFLSSVWAMAAGVILFRQAAEVRRWLRGWREYVAGWREDLGLMWVALCMTARLEFA